MPIVCLSMGKDNTNLIEPKIPNKYNLLILKEFIIQSGLAI